MTSTLVAVALAASTSITAAPAFADSGFKHGVHKSHNGHSFRNRGFNHRRAALIKKKKAFFGIRSYGHHNSRRHHTPVRYQVNDYGQSLYQVSQLKRQALHSCSAQLRRDAYSFGYKGVRLTGADIKQVDKDKFVIHAGAKLFDGYKLNHEAYDCTVKHGQVIDAFKPKKLNF